MMTTTHGEVNFPSPLISLFDAVPLTSFFHPKSLPFSYISHTSGCWCVDYPWRLNAAKGPRYMVKKEGRNRGGEEEGGSNEEFSLSFKVALSLCVY